MAFWILSMYYKILTKKPNNNFPPAFLPSNLCLSQFIVFQSIFITVMKYLRPSNLFYLFFLKWKQVYLAHISGAGTGINMVQVSLMEISS